MDEITKVCFKCGAFQPLSDFYRHPAMADGHLNKCKECTKQDVKENREKNLERVQEYDRNRPNREERVKRACEKIKARKESDPEYKERVRNIKREWAERNQHKRKAQFAATNAVRDGRLERKTSCEHCGVVGKPLQKHHWSYLEEHWLDVVWLCTKCHGAEHRRLNELGRDPDKGFDK